MSDNAKSKRPWYVNCLLVFGGFIVLIIIIAVASSGGSSTDSSDNGSTGNGGTNSASETAYGLEQEAPAGDLIFTANSITKKATIGSSYSAKTSQSGTYLLVNVTVENSGNETITIDSSLFSLTDSEGREFSHSNEGQTALIMSGSNNFFLKQVQPGLSSTGDVVFEIPTDATGLQLTVKPSIFSGKKATISLE
ncbi:MAG: DUF4352 domain-containing protein [Candidatus Uhrbacteria bacterium]|nr:DUF4352 domain-containing protein [Candidatus Uhrbacteria bacterium]